MAMIYSEQYASVLKISLIFAKGIVFFQLLRKFLKATILSLDLPKSKNMQENGTF